MHSSANRVRLPGIEDIEKYHGDYEDAIEEDLADPRELIREAKEECERMIAKAVAEADRITEKAKAEGEKLKEAQANLGYIEGKNKGEKEMETLMNQLIEEQKAEFAREVAAIKGYREQMFEAVKGHVIECLKLLCKKIIFREYKDDDFIINTMIDHYYYMIKDRSNLVLTVSHEDYRKLDMMSLESKGIKVKVDETFMHGDLTISCDAEGINFGLNEQIEKAGSSIGV